jgi:hypothetical protein
MVFMVSKGTMICIGIHIVFDTVDTFVATPLDEESSIVLDLPSKNPSLRGQRI